MWPDLWKVPYWFIKFLSIFEFYKTSWLFNHCPCITLQYFATLTQKVTQSLNLKYCLLVSLVCQLRGKCTLFDHILWTTLYRRHIYLHIVNASIADRHFYTEFKTQLKRHSLFSGKMYEARVWTKLFVLFLSLPFHYIVTSPWIQSLSSQTHCSALLWLTVLF